MSVTSTGYLDGGMAFMIEQDGHNFVLDASPDWGGIDRGPRPKTLLLSGLIGCTGMDVVSILAKMKIENFKLSIKADAELTEEHPKIFRSIHLTYVFEGEDLPEQKIRKAVDLSQERYCGVTEILRKSASMSLEIIIQENR